MKSFKEYLPCTSSWDSRAHYLRLDGLKAECCLSWLWSGTRILEFEISSQHQLGPSLPKSQTSIRGRITLPVTIAALANEILHIAKKN